MTVSIRDDWDRHWQEFNQTAEQNPAQNYRREWILAMLGIAGSGQGARIIDIGSGQGDMAAAIRAKFSSLYSARPSRRDRAAGGSTRLGDPRDLF